ncbi:MAG: hypothetical protein ACREWE_09650 [Gammaproteobacteria bacterium]
MALSIPHGSFMLMGWTPLQEAIALAGSQAELAYMLGVVPMAGTSRKRRGVPAAVAFTHGLAETLRGLFSIGTGGDRATVLTREEWYETEEEAIPCGWRINSASTSHVRART